MTEVLYNSLFSFGRGTFKHWWKVYTQLKYTFKLNWVSSYIGDGKIVEIVQCGLGKHAKNSDDRTKELRSTESNNGQKFCEQDLLCASRLAVAFDRMEDNDIIVAGDFSKIKIHRCIFLKMYLYTVVKQ